MYGLQTKTNYQQLHNFDIADETYLNNSFFFFGRAGIGVGTSSIEFSSRSSVMILSWLFLESVTVVSPFGWTLDEIVTVSFTADELTTVSLTVGSTRYVSSGFCGTDLGAASLESALGSSEFFFVVSSSFGSSFIRRGSGYFYNRSINKNRIIN